MKELLEAIDIGLSNRYQVLDGDDYTLCIKDCKTGKHFDIKVEEVEE